MKKMSSFLAVLLAAVLMVTSVPSQAAAGEEMNWQDFVNKDYDRNNANTGTRATFIPYDFVPLPEPVMIHD